MKNNNRLKHFFIYAIIVLLGSACTDFEEMNTDPSKSPSIDPNVQLTMCQLQTWGNWRGSQSFTFYLSGFMQYQQGDWNSTSFGGQYRKSNNEFLQTWEELYGNQVKNLVDIIHRTEDDASKHNIRQVSRIFKVYIFSILTDLYGDIPYFEAGRGYIGNIVKPKYDAQEDIYTDFPKELQEAADALDSDMDRITGDLIYGGNIAKWQRLANSLSLRYAMRLTKVDPEKAKQEVIRLTSNDYGFIQNQSEEAIINYSDIYDWDAAEVRRNALSQMWRGREPYPTVYICRTLWDMLKSKNDPRLYVYGRCYDESSPNNPFGRVDLTEEMISMGDLSKFQACKPGFYWWDEWPSGYWSNSTQKWQDKATRPQINNVFLKGNTPGIIMTYSETQFLLCEAKTRFGTEIVTGGIAGMHYKNAINGAFDMLGRYEVRISQEDRDKYISENPFPGSSMPEERLKAINEQLWILHFNNTPEGYANWRRSGYPELLSSSNYGAVTIDSREIPRRLCYPLFESSYNPEGYAWAIERLGGTDNWNKSVWWDK